MSVTPHNAGFSGRPNDPDPKLKSGVDARWADPNKFGVMAYMYRRTLQTVIFT